MHRLLKIVKAAAVVGTLTEAGKCYAFELSILDRIRDCVWGKRETCGSQEAAYVRFLLLEHQVMDAKQRYIGLDQAPSSTYGKTKAFIIPHASGS